MPDDFWKIVEDGWLKHQHSSGGWTYKAPEETNHPVTPGMTAAGVATLYITQDYLAANRGLDCRPVPPTPAGAASERGMQWLVDNFSKVATDERYDRDWPFPTLYAVERVGVASGRRYFGDIDWYQQGADWLLKSQKKNGAWSDSGRSSGHLTDTCFAMLFLARASAGGHQQARLRRRQCQDQLERPPARCRKPYSLDRRSDRARIELADRESRRSSVGLERRAGPLHRGQRDAGAC